MRLCQRNLGSLSQRHGQSSLWTSWSYYFWFYPCPCGFPPQWWDLRLDWDDWQMPPWQSQGVVSTNDDAWCGWISGGDPADRDEFSRMRHSLIDPLHFLLFTLFGAGLLPLPAANCQSLLSLEAHIFTNWHLQSWSCFPVGLHHLLVVRCGLLATFSGKRRRGFETNISGCGRLLGRSCYR